jgi:hypothetical protein
VRFTQGLVLAFSREVFNNVEQACGIKRFVAEG